MLPLTWPAYRRTAAGRHCAGARDKDWDSMADVTRNCCPVINTGDRIGGSTTRTRVPAEARRCAPVALRTLQGLACLGDGRASAAHHAVQGETTMPLYEQGDIRI